MKTKSSNLQPKGFTLIEMLVVITIIIILAGLSMGGYSFVIQKQANSQAKIQISLLSKALEEYKLDNGEYPDTDKTNDLYKALYWDSDNNGTGADTDTDQKIYVSQLDPDNDNQGWTEGTGANAKIVDPWGKEYIYRRGDHDKAKNPDFDLLSKGTDGIEGNADDIDNF
ncbi:MAG: type II secretion system protein GspG [Akkermansiaceae bacterium]|nr:type II secretion system protein GspG [Akkermansiaceae bacterium]